MRFLRMRLDFTKIILIAVLVLFATVVYRFGKSNNQVVNNKFEKVSGMIGNREQFGLKDKVREKYETAKPSVREQEVEKKSDNETQDLKSIHDKEIILSTAREITKDGDILLVSFITSAYLPFAYSWLCNIADMKITHQLLIIAADEETAVDLQKNRPDIKTVAISGYQMKGDQSYTRAGYVRIGIKRTVILNWILQDNIGIFLFEFDCLWLRNPMPAMTQFKDYDLVITPVAERPGMVAIGFYYMAPTDRMKKLWQELTRRLTILDKKLQKMKANTVISEGDNDQLYLTQLIKEKYGNIRLKLLDLKQYPDGKWYNLPESKRSLQNLYIINNNWVVGNKAKIDRAKKFGHWFLKNDGTCDDEQVNKIVQMY